jgi:hypothetical protein
MVQLFINRRQVATPKAFRQSPFCTEISTPVEKRRFREPGKAGGFLSANRLKLPQRTRREKRFRGTRGGGRIDRKDQRGVDLHLCPGKARPIGGLGPGARANSHETDLPAEQPQAEEDPRLLGAHAPEGGPPRTQEAAPEGAEADRSLTRGGGAARNKAAPRRADGPRFRVPEGLSAGNPPRRAAVRDGGDRERAGLQSAGSGRLPQGRRSRGPEPGQARPPRKLPAAEDPARVRPGADPQARDSQVHTSGGPA